MFVTPFTDNVPGHAGEGLGLPVDARVRGSYEIDQNGVKLAGGNVFSLWQASLRPTPSALRFVLDISRSGSAYPLSTRNHTVWTWQYTPQRGATLPAGWICTASRFISPHTRNCSAQPLLSLNYNVARESLRGSVPAGPQAVTIDVTHFQPSTSTAKMTGAHVRVSFDNGTTWQVAAVTRHGPGRFLATFTAPRTARFVALMVTTADGGGSAVQEILWRAYSITP